MREERMGLRRIRRRDFLKGVGAGAAALGLAGCGVDFARERSGGQNPSKVKGEFSWTREKGKTINVLFAKHPMADSFIKELGNFEKKTGIKVQYDTLPEEEFFQKLRTDLSTGKGNYDAFMSGPPNNWEFAAPGWSEPLDAYIENKALTSADYDLDDFYPAALGVNRWRGKLWSIPANEEGYSLFSRKDILEEAGIEAPQTWDDLISAVKEVDGKTFGGKKVDGFVARGDKTFPTIQSGYSTAFLGYGATDVDDNGKVVINSPEGVKATEKWAEVMGHAPDNVGTFTWYEAMNHFSAGNAAFFIDADHMSEAFEDPEASVVAGKVDYGLPPEGDAGRMGNIWLWSLAMSASSKNNIAAWIFLQWATTKEQLEKAITEGNINPTRRSLANSETMKGYTKDWGAYNETWQTILSDHAAWNYIKSPKYPAFGDRWALAIQEIALGGGSIKETLDAAATEMQDIYDSAKG
ncbi:MAG: sugar ABC transporter substrate-binding protein [Actinomycetota bacterium]|nr:sugar ABC transporter substrate-binding protein [Actinomycetota bacterium]